MTTTLRAWTLRHPIDHPRNRMAIRRGELGWTIKQAASACGLCVTTYWRAECGCDCMLTTAQAIAAGLQSTVEAIWPT